MSSTKHFLLLFLSVFLSVSVYAQASLTFRSLTELYAYADLNSKSFQNAGQQTTLARYQTLAAKLGKWNLQGRTNFTITDNTKLNTSFIPAELFGGQEGTFRPITFGQKYESNVAFAPQIDLINPYAAALVKAAKTNEQLVSVNNLLDKKAVYESISAAYHNIFSFQQQIVITGKSLSNADTLTYILQNKQKEGMARGQDVNIALANKLNLEDKLQQLKVQLSQQYNSLKILVDVDSATTVQLETTEIPEQSGILQASAGSNLLQRQAEWQIKYQEANLRADKRWIYPTLNFFSSFGWQQTTNNNFFDRSKWFGTSYVGLRLSIPLLPETSKIASVKYDRINLQIARNNQQHNSLQDRINNNQLELDGKKADKSYRLALQIESLHKDTYYKNLNIYREGILSAKDLIDSFNEWLNSSLNTVALQATVEYLKSKITISNTIK